MTLSLEQLVARAEITDALMRYCRALDRMDRPLAESIWHADAAVDYRGYFAGTASQFLDSVWQAHSALDRHAHQVTNVLVNVESAWRATSEAYVTVILRSRAEDGDATVFAGVGRYLDTWACIDGRWAITSRTYIDDLAHLAGPAFAAEPPGSARDRSDLSYSILAW